MASKMGSIYVDITANMKGLQKNLQKAQSSLRSVGKKMTGIGTKMSLGITAPLALVGKTMISAASDMEESLNKVDVAFKDSSQEVKDFAKTTLESFGIAEGTALDLLSLFGDMATGMGINTSEASKMAQSLTGLAGDLASFKNIRIDVAQTALKSVYTGETESLKNLGIVMTQANLEQFAMAKGIEKSIKDMTEAEKVQLRYSFVLDKTKNAQGDFARTSDGAANSTRIYQETLKELSAEFGKVLLPLFTKVVQYLTDVTKKFKSLSPNVQKVILIVLGLGAVIGPLIAIVGMLSTGISALASVLGAISAPVLAVIAVIAAFIGIIVYAWKTNEDFRDAVLKVWDKIKEAGIMIFEALKKFWDRWGDYITKSFKAYFDMIVSVLTTALKVLSNIFDFWIGVFTGDWDRAWGGIKGAYKAIWDGIVSILKIAWDAIASIFTTQTNWVTDKFNKLKLALKIIWDEIVKVFKVALDLLQNALKFWIAIFTGDWKGAWESLKNIFKSVWDGIVSIFGKQIDWIMSKVKKVTDAIKKVKNAAKSIGKGVSKGVSSVTGFIKSKVPKFDVGTNYVPRDMLAMVHKGEAIVPAKYNNAKGIGGGGITINVTGNTISNRNDVDRIASTMVRKLRMAGV